MDKETLYTLGKSYQWFDGNRKESCEGWTFNTETQLLSFAQSCCDWQKEKDAQICDYIAASHLEFVGDAADCADAIRNAKEIPRRAI